MSEDVKGVRQYDSSGRLAQAEANRRAILDAAERQFLSNGFGATTIAAIAREAGVSVQTIYKGFGGKSGLLRAIHDRGLEGRGPIAAEQRSDEMREQETDPRTIMQNWGKLAAEIGPIVAPIRLLMRAAATNDADMAAILVTIDEQRLTRMRHLAQSMADRGYFRDGVTVDHAADIFWHCTSAELYEIFVLQRHWSLTRFGQFIADFMITALLPQ